MAGFLMIWILIAVIAFIAFGFLNQGIWVYSISVGFREFFHISLSLIVFVSFMIGFCYSLILGIVQEFRLRAKIRKYRNMQDSLLEELDALRRVPVERISAEGKEEEEEDVS